MTQIFLVREIIERESSVRISFKCFIAFRTERIDFVGGLVGSKRHRESLEGYIKPFIAVNRLTPDILEKWSILR